MSVIYREANENDAEALLEHLSAVGKETDNLSFGEDTFKISKEREIRFINRFKNSQNDILLVAYDGNTVVGNAAVVRNRIARYSHRAEISITVLREFWGRGIGSELMKRMIEFAKESGVEVLYLETRSDNERAIALYNKFGFKPIGTYKKFLKIGNCYHDALLMTLNL